MFQRSNTLRSDDIVSLVRMNEEPDGMGVPCLSLEYSRKLATVPHPIFSFTFRTVLLGDHPQDNEMLQSRDDSNFGLKY